MAKKDPLTVLDPSPVGNETQPLLNASGPTQPTQNGTFDNEPTGETLSQDDVEARAAQERREYDANSAPVADEPSTLKLALTMSSMWLSTFFAALDSTVVATLSGTISNDFDSFTLFSWLASGYLIANAAIQPLSGKLTDIYGRRAGLIFASTFFAIGTLMCGLAQEQWVIILGRVIAGAGGGCLNTISTFIGSDLIPLRRRGVWQGIGNIVYGTGMGLGGVFGGFINDRIGWRWAFHIQVPFIVVAGIWACCMVNVPVKDTDTAKIKRVDFLGAFLLSASLVLLLLGLNSGGNIVPWNHPLVYVPLPLSFICLLGFIYVEDKIAPEPVIPVRLLLHRTVAAACLTNWFETMSVFGLLYYGPIYFQVILNLSATQAGVRLIPQSVGAAIGSLSCGLIMRATGRYFWLNVFMQLLSLVACALILGTFNEHVELVPPFIYLFMEGTAYGAMLTITLLSLIAAVDHKYQALITSASYAFRSTGSTIGITIASTVFQNVLKQKLYEEFGDGPDATEQIRRIRNSVDEVRRLPAGWHDAVITAYMNALQGVWVVVFGFAVLAALTSLFIREHILYGNLERRNSK
ncbi:putative major facilitator superfamily transporter [Polychaeton citri CBS 116435]|uniref:Major facilitator superfamily transporter n=1 Tax=Polychaeton citri CBS 116435 TaxID=1314669 RepID=A0A9P4QK19_9PEZI|nr:putative major facilitator superfamily transporter [Polychaeton citri CBS 116435]